MYLRRLPTHLTRLIAVLSLALILGGLFAPASSASAPNSFDVVVEQRVGMVWSMCVDAGGTPSVHYDMFGDGHIYEATVSCTFITHRNWSCTASFDGSFRCVVEGLTRPPETLAQSVTAPTGSIGGVLETEQAPLTDPLVENTDNGGQQVTDRPTTEPVGDETGGAGREAPASTPAAENGGREP